MAANYQAHDQCTNASTRWKLVRGRAADVPDAVPLPPDYSRMDEVLTALYDGDEAGRKAGLGGSAPRVSRWPGDIRA